MHVAFIAPCTFTMQQDKTKTNNPSYFSSGKTVVTTQYIQISIKINPDSRIYITVNLDRKKTLLKYEKYIYILFQILPYISFSIFIFKFVYIQHTGCPTMLSSILGYVIHLFSLPEQLQLGYFIFLLYKGLKKKNNPFNLKTIHYQKLFKT